MLAWGLWALILAGSVVDYWLSLANGNPILALDEFILVAIFVLFSAVGAVIASRVPQNPIGWIYVAAGLTPIGALAQQYAVYGLVTVPGPLPGVVLAAWFGSWATYLGWGIAFTFTLLLFPTGRLPSARWRPLAWLTAAGLAAVSIQYATTSGPIHSIPSLRGLPPIDNPFAIPALSTPLAQVSRGVVGQLLYGALVVGCAAAAVFRFARSQGDERMQLKWFSMAVLLVLTVPAAQGLLERIDPELEIIGSLLFAAAAMTVPVSVGIAILRYRLYDIDVLINRTLVYAAVTATLGAVFFGGLVVLQTLLRPLTSGSELAIAASTLVSLALFQPVRRRVQDTVDRRFNRSRHDAARTLDAFADRLRDEVNLDALHSDLLDAVDETMAPASMSLWLRERPG
jgi:hypothetical protein